MLILRTVLFHIIGNVLSPSGGRARLSILIYHRVLAASDPMLHDEIDAGTFERHMGLLAREFNVLPLGEACERLGRGTLPTRAACITFDDGYASNEEVALPILRHFGLTATFFISTGFTDGGMMFNDVVIEAARRAPGGVYDLSDIGFGVHALDNSASRRAAVDAMIPRLKYQLPQERSASLERLLSAMRAKLPINLMMRSEQIRRLHASGMEIGAHTVNHPILATLEDGEARAEIVTGKRRLEEIIGVPVKLFAYPNGKPGRDYGPRDVRLVKEAGFVAAVSTQSGVASRASDLFELPRFSPWERNPRKLALRLLASCWRAVPHSAPQTAVSA